MPTKMLQSTSASIHARKNNYALLASISCRGSPPFGGDLFLRSGNDCVVCERTGHNNSTADQPDCPRRRTTHLERWRGWNDAAGVSMVQASRGYCRCDATNARASDRDI